MPPVRACAAQGSVVVGCSATQSDWPPSPRRAPRSRSRSNSHSRSRSRSRSARAAALPASGFGRGAAITHAARASRERRHAASERRGQRDVTALLWWYPTQVAQRLETQGGVQLAVRRQQVRRPCAGAALEAQSAGRLSGGSVIVTTAASLVSGWGRGRHERSREHHGGSTMAPEGWQGSWHCGSVTGWGAGP